jgi:hypothetical protein
VTISRLVFDEEELSQEAAVFSGETAWDSEPELASVEGTGK